MGSHYSYCGIMVIRMIKELLAEVQAAILGWLHPGFVPITLGSAYRIYRTHPTKKEAIDIIISSWMILYLFGDTVLKIPTDIQVFIYFLMGVASAGIVNTIVDNADDLGMTLLKKYLGKQGLEIHEKAPKSTEEVKKPCEPNVV